MVSLRYRATSRSQAPDNRGSARVRSCDRDTRGIKMGLVPKNKNLTNIFLSRAVLDSERPEDSKNAGARPSIEPPKIRIRYNDMARCRYKKILKERRGTNVALITPPIAEDKMKERCASVGAVNAPDRRTIPLALRTRNPRSLTKDCMPRRGIIKLILVFEGFPENKLGAEDIKSGN